MSSQFRHWVYLIVSSNRLHFRVHPQLHTKMEREIIISWERYLCWAPVLAYFFFFALFHLIPRTILKWKHHPLTNEVIFSGKINLTHLELAMQLEEGQRSEWDESVFPIKNKQTKVDEPVKQTARWAGWWRKIGDKSQRISHIKLSMSKSLQSKVLT